MALAFLGIIFYVGTALFSKTVVNIGSFPNNKVADVFALRDQIDDEYRNMLGYKGNYLIDKGAYINLNGLMARLMGQRYMNERVKLDNGHLTILYAKAGNLTPAVVQMTKLYIKQKENGKHFLFVLAPIHVPKDENILPAGYKDYSNQNADQLLNMLRANDVPVMDLRDEMVRDGINHTDAFFATDHHWKPETGFWAYTKIIDYFEQFGIIDPIDPIYTDLNYFNVDTYKDWFLGSAGKRTGSYYAGVDDFSVITPKFETNMSLSIPSGSLFNQGAFRDVTLNWRVNTKNYFTVDPHSLYGHGTRDFKSYRNENAPIGLRILGLGDSFSNIPFAFLSLCTSILDTADMRKYNGDFAKYYSEFNPDIVIVLINPGQVAERDISYDFFS